MSETLRDYHVVFYVIGVLGLIVAVIAEIDISRHRRNHERRSVARRETDR